MIKLSGTPAKDSQTGRPVTRVWRGVRETRMKLPREFVEPCEANQGFPGGAECGFSSTTTDVFTAYSYSGGWEVPGTILEISYDAASRGADVQFLSCYPRERELLLPPFCMFSVHGIQQRGYKRFIKCGLTVNPSAFDLGIERRVGGVARHDVALHQPGLELPVQHDVHPQDLEATAPLHLQ